VRIPAALTSADDECRGATQADRIATMYQEYLRESAVDLMLAGSDSNGTRRLALKEITDTGQNDIRVVAITCDHAVP
jgi:hypothetical protein